MVYVTPAHSEVCPLRQRTLQAPIRELLATRQCLGAGVGRGEDGVGTGVMWGGGVGRDTAVGRGEGGGGTGVM
jgi:hypothetical protein